LPPLEDYDITKGRTYWYFDGEPLYHFGHGLSYTTFEYSNLITSSKTFDIFEDNTLTVTVTVENTGEHDGDEVVQLYIKDPEKTFTMPKKKLRAFKRVHIPADEQTNVTFILSRDDFSFWHPDADSWAVETGDFEIQIGSSSEDIRLTSTITVPE
jgi:beta-glucosidase